MKKTNDFKERRIPVIVDEVCEKEGFTVEYPRAVILNGESIKITGHIKSANPVYDADVCIVAAIENKDNEILNSDYDRVKFFSTSGIFDMNFTKYRIEGYVNDIETIDHIRVLIGKSRTIVEAFS